MKINLPWRVHAEIAETCATPDERAQAYERLRWFHVGIARYPGLHEPPTDEQIAQRAAAIAGRYPWVAEYWARQPSLPAS